MRSQNQGLNTNTPHMAQFVPTPGLEDSIHLPHQFIDKRVEQKGGGDEIVHQKEPDVQEYDNPFMNKSRTDENVVLISDPLVDVKNEEFIDNVDVMPAVMEAPKVQKPATNEYSVVKEVKHVETVKKAIEKKLNTQKSSKSQSSDMAKTIFKPQQQQPKEPESDLAKLREVEMETSQVKETKYNILDHVMANENTHRLLL